jgi:hypothetical protein
LAPYTTKHRGPLLIHAGLKEDPLGYTWCERLGIEVPKELPHGAVIGSVQVVGCEEGVGSPWAIDDCYHWVLADAREMDPVPVTGKLGIFDAGPALRSFPPKR